MHQSDLARSNINTRMSAVFTHERIHNQSRPQSIQEKLTRIMTINFFLPQQQKREFVSIFVHLLISRDMQIVVHATFGDINSGFFSHRKYNLVTKLFSRNIIS